MDNPRPEKVALVAEVKERLETSTAVMVTEYRGLTVDEFQELRRSMRPVGGKTKVYKNTLVRRASDEAGVDLGEENLLGPTALTFVEPTEDGGRGDVVSVAKVLKDFAKTHPNLVLKGGHFDGGVIGADDIRRLADIEPREVLLAKLAGLMAAPMQQFAGLMQAVPRNFAYGLKALIEEGGAPGAPASSTTETVSDTADDSADSGSEEPQESADGEEE